MGRWFEGRSRVAASLEQNTKQGTQILHFRRPVLRFEFLDLEKQRKNVQRFSRRFESVPVDFRWGSVYIREFQRRAEGFQGASEGRLGDSFQLISEYSEAFQSYTRWAQEVFSRFQLRFETLWSPSGTSSKTTVKAT